jgi:hypothetical protein
MAADLRIDLVLPPLPAEHTEMAGAGLQVPALAERRERYTEVVRGRGLADAADVVALALDRQQRGARDRRRIDRPPAPRELAAGEQVLLEDRGDRLEVELGRQVEDGEVLVVERLRRERPLRVALAMSS